MQIISITIIRGYGPDTVFFETNLPSPIGDCHNNAQLKLESCKDKTEMFLKNHFPNIQYKIIYMPN
jgi:hypothetical protein